MKAKLFVVLLAVSILSGCYGYMKLYPVQGPLATQTPLPVLAAKVTGNVKGTISLVLPDGEKCSGHWSRVAKVSTPSGEATTNASPTSAMASLWDTVYGPGFYVSHVLGTDWHTTAVVTGDRGTVLDVETYASRRHHEEAAKGVAKDNKGNIYKVVF